jgi:hypothetical protein
MKDSIANLGSSGNTLHFAEKQKGDVDQNHQYVLKAFGIQRGGSDGFGLKNPAILS